MYSACGSRPPPFERIAFKEQIMQSTSSPLPASNSTPHALMTPRRPLVAALASLVLPGFGQFYNGDLNRAIWLFLIFALLCIPGMALVALYLPSAWMLPTLLLGLLAALGVWGYAVWDAWHSARRQPVIVARPWQMSGVYALVFVLCNLLALPLLTLYVRQHQVEPFSIPSASMEPSVLKGDKIWADKRYNCPGCRQGVHRGDIAIFAYPNDRSVHYIKRVIGLPGDHIQLKERQLWVNGETLLRSTAPGPTGTMTEGIAGREWQVQWAEPPAAAKPATPTPPLNRAQTVPAQELQLTVPDGQVFVIGDNRLQSTDSRNFGTVPMQDILGRARQVWYSSNEQGVRWARLGLVLK
jgi:signal peptidase I